MPQLTLTLDDHVWQAAQAYAQQHGQALDALVVNFLQTIAEPASPPLVRPSLATVQQLSGSLKAPADFDYKKELEEGRAEQYGL